MEISHYSSESLTAQIYTCKRQALNALERTQPIYVYYCLLTLCSQKCLNKTLFLELQEEERHGQSGLQQILMMRLSLLLLEQLFTNNFKKKKLSFSLSSKSFEHEAGKLFSHLFFIIRKPNCSMFDSIQTRRKMAQQIRKKTNKHKSLQNFVESGGPPLPSHSMYLTEEEMKIIYLKEPITY